MDLLDYFDNYMELKEELEKLFQRPVDLLEIKQLKNPVLRKVIDREKRLVCERKKITSFFPYQF